MDPQDFSPSQRTYLRKTLEGHIAFFPPPTARAINLDPGDIALLSTADRALGAAVARESWTVPPLFRLLREWGGVSDQEAFDTWNMGIGLVAVIAPTDERAALRALPDAIRIGAVERASGSRLVRWS